MVMMKMRMSMIVLIIITRDFKSPNVLMVSFSYDAPVVAKVSITIIILSHYD